MKKVLFAISLSMALAPISKAEKLPVAEVINSSITVHVISCSSSTATLMDSTSTTKAMVGREFVAMQNQDITNKVDIGFNVNLSSSAYNLVLPENFAIISLPLGLFKSGGPYQAEVLNVWCKSRSTSGPSNVSLIQGKGI